MISPHSSRPIFALAILAALPALGCASAPATVALPAAPTGPRTATLIYGSLPSISRHQQNQAVRLAGYEPSSQGQLLLLQFPHPDGKPNMARAILVSQHPSTASDQATNSAIGRRLIDALDRNLPGVRSGDEALALDIPQSEAQTLLALLESAGCFDPNVALGDVHRLWANIDGRCVARPWPATADFARLAERVRDEGHLIALENGTSEHLFAQLASANSAPSQNRVVAALALRRLPPVR